MVNLQKYVQQAQNKAESLAKQHGIQIPGLNSNSQQNVNQSQAQYAYYQQPSTTHYPVYHPHTQYQGGYAQNPPQNPPQLQSYPQQMQMQTPPPPPAADTHIACDSTYWNAPFKPITPVSMSFKHQVGNNGWGNNEAQNYVQAKENSFHSQGNALVIRAIKNGASCVSARLTSLASLGKDRGSLRVIVSPSCAAGICSSLRLLPGEPFKWPDEGEIGILETCNGDLSNHSGLMFGHRNEKAWDRHEVVDTRIGNMSSGSPLLFELVWDQCAEVENGRLVWYINGRPIMKANMPKGTRRLREWQIVINVAMGGDLCKGQLPQDGTYDLTVHTLSLGDEPSNGWDGFEQDFRNAPKGDRCRP